MRDPEKPRKFFADSPWYTVVFMILCVLMILSVIPVCLFFVYFIQFRLIMQHARELGPWWIVLTVLHFFVLASSAAILLGIRKRRETRFIVGDELYFMTHGKTLRFELFWERTKRTFLEKLTGSTRGKSKKELFLEDCAEKRRKMLENGL